MGVNVLVMEEDDWVRLLPDDGRSAIAKSTAKPRIERDASIFDAEDPREEELADIEEDLDVDPDGFEEIGEVFNLGDGEA